MSLLSSRLFTSAPKPMPAFSERLRMTFSRPSKAPPQMNRMLVVSTWTKSWFGCLRPPCGGTEAMVPSISFSSACCTPSPETSRVIDGLSRLARNLVDLVDVDDALLRLLDVVVALLQQLLDDVLDVLADIAGFGQRRRVGHDEGHVEQARQRLRQQRLAGAGRADQQDVALGQFDLVVLRPVLEPLVVVVDRDREDLLRRLLADHVLVEDARRSPAASAGRTWRALPPWSAAISSRMMSLHSSMHSSQMNTDGPGDELRTSCWLLPQNEQ